VCVHTHVCVSFWMLTRVEQILIVHTKTAVLATAVQCHTVYTKYGYACGMENCNQ